jgi:hypothetical protein
MTMTISAGILMSNIVQGRNIYDVTVQDQFTFSKEMEEKKIDVLSATFKSIVSISRFKSSKPILFKACTFEDDFYLDDSCEIEELLFWDCKFNSELFINESKVNRLTLKEVYCTHGIISEKLICNFLNIELLTSDNSKFAFHEPMITTCTISKLRDSSDLIFTSHSRKDNLHSGSTIGGLQYTADSQFSGSLILLGPVVNVLGLSGFNKSGRLIFQDLKVRLISCGQLINTGLITVSNITTDLYSIIQVHRSNLGKCEIFDVNFAAFKSIKIDNSNIQEIIATNVTWCEKIESDLFGNNKLPHLRETYRQLKNVVMRQNDKVQELKYHELEMTAYLKQIKKEKGNFYDWFIIWGNHVSNRHGLSWMRALTLLLFLGMLFFQVNKGLLGYSSFNSELFWKDLANYVESLNPIRKFSDIYIKYDSGWKSNLAVFLDVIFRILSSYLIFQFVSAFRKYAKK